MLLWEILNITVCFEIQTKHVSKHRGAYSNCCALNRHNSEKMNLFYFDYIIITVNGITVFVQIGLRHYLQNHLRYALHSLHNVTYFSFCARLETPRTSNVPDFAASNYEQFLVSNKFSCVCISSVIIKCNFRCSFLFNVWDNSMHTFHLLYLSWTPSQCCSLKGKYYFMAICELF